MPRSSSRSGQWTPSAISSKFSRAAALAARRRGYHSSGVAILRPSAKVTTRSLAVNATETGRRSARSISKVLMPFDHEDIPLRSQVADNSADFMGGKSGIGGNGQVMKPELGFAIAGPDMNMRRFATFVRVEERPVRSSAQDRRHSVLVISFVDEVELVSHRPHRFEAPHPDPLPACGERACGAHLPARLRPSCPRVALSVCGLARGFRPAPRIPRKALRRKPPSSPALRVL